MFATAYSQATAFTRPVIISRVFQNGQCGSGVGTFIVVNDEGWVLTAGHILQQLIQLVEEKKKLQDHAEAVAAIQADRGLLPNQKRNKIRALPAIRNGLQIFHSGGVSTTRS